jgi:Family of unknown function (DUF5309)
MAMVYNSNLIGKKESVVDEILLLDPHMTPMLSLLGFSAPVTQVEHIWYEDEMFPIETTANANKLSTDTTLSVASVEPFRVGQIVRCKDELMEVTAVGAGTITVVRGYAGTTAAAISSGDTIEVLFVKGQEGANARAGRYKQRVKKSNLTQIFDDSIEVSGTAQVVKQYGVGDIYEYEKQKVQKMLALQLEKAVIDGIYLDNGAIRQMRGVRQFIATHAANAGAAALTLDKINDSLQDIYEAGGFNNGASYVVIAPAKQKRVISGFSNDKIEIQQSERLRGQVVDGIVTDFGQFPVLLNNNLRPDEILIVDTNRIAIRPLEGREFFHKYMGDQGDFVKGMVVGEYTLEFKEEKAHARIYNLA